MEDLLFLENDNHGFPWFGSYSEGKYEEMALFQEKS